MSKLERRKLHTEMMELWGKAETGEQFADVCFMEKTLIDDIKKARSRN